MHLPFNDLVRGLQCPANPGVIVVYLSIAAIKTTVKPKYHANTEATLKWYGKL